MTQLLHCTLYYSTIGESFNIYERNTDPNLVRTQALVHFGVNKYACVPAMGGTDTDIDPHYEEVTRLMIPHGVKGGGPFYSSDTLCIIVNGKNQILKLGGQYRFGIRMYRDLDNPEQFSVIFKDNEFTAPPHWVSF
ncbi:hypothetical protein [Taibaiella koreensis]|uniref:hypothetical protein n=1 Tax=Taibaiella koreensis TaxID=1268548 RepID=UPI000E59E272|nr:hypothetical protein [Taibaiella koreensis]